MAGRPELCTEWGTAAAVSGPAALVLARLGAGFLGAGDPGLGLIDGAAAVHCGGLCGNTNRMHAAEEREQRIARPVLRGDLVEIDQAGSIDDGWLILYHGVENKNEVGVYRTYWALLDKKDPLIIKHLADEDPLLEANSSLTEIIKKDIYLNDIE